MGNADFALLPRLFRGDICNRFLCLIPLLSKGLFFSGGTGDWSSAGSTFGFASSTQGRELCSDANQPWGTGHARVIRPVIVHFKTLRNFLSPLASVASEVWRWIVEESGRHMLPFRSLDLDKEPFPKVLASLPKKQLPPNNFCPYLKAI